MNSLYSCWCSANSDWPTATMSNNLTLRALLFATFISFSLCQNATTFEYGFLLSSGTRLIHGEGSFVKDAYPPDLNIPATPRILNPGHTIDPTTPSVSGQRDDFERNIFLHEDVLIVSSALNGPAPWVSSSSTSQFVCHDTST